MKYCFLICFFIITGHFAVCNTDSVTNEAIHTIYLKKSIEQTKLKNIKKLKDSLFKTTDPYQRRDYIFKLIQQYKKYQIDTAITYALAYKAIGEELKDIDVVNESSIYLASFYSSSAKFIESENTLQSINRTLLSERLLPAYYEAYSEFSSHYGQNSDNYLYFKKSEEYRDSLLSVLDEKSNKYKVTLATKLLYNHQQDDAKKILLPLLESTSDSQDDRGLIAYLLGVISKHENQAAKELYYLSISAIYDVKNVVKDNASLAALASLYYESDQVDNAYLFIQEAINDAVFCNIRYRSLENSTFYSVIIDAFQKKEDARKAKLTNYLILISALTLLLLIAFVILYFQILKLRRIKDALKHANDELIVLNDRMSSVNIELSEANHIKEEYIAQFFDLCSSYIDKLDNNRKILFKKFTNKQYDEIGLILKSNDFVKLELDDLYRNFDIIFLNLYPNFIRDFNELLRPEERIILKPDEMLNMELRIFALIRLGINDSSKIANFLRYSLRTVYNYRVKVRNKVLGSKDDFEEKIKNIGNIRQF